MTLKEADEAAMLMRPVICDGIEYRRITFVGRSYDEYGRPSGTVQLLDRRANSVTWADPKKVELKGGEWE